MLSVPSISRLIAKRKKMLMVPAARSAAFPIWSGWNSSSTKRSHSRLT